MITDIASSLDTIYIEEITALASVEGLDDLDTLDTLEGCINERVKKCIVLKAAIKAIEAVAMMPDSPILLLNYESIGARVMVHLDKECALLRLFPYTDTNTNADLAAFALVYSESGADFGPCEEELVTMLRTRFPHVECIGDNFDGFYC
jgi:hypothetical protein